jgi:hypothetical protein
MEGDTAVNGNHLLCGVVSTCAMHDGYKDE